MKTLTALALVLATFSTARAQGPNDAERQAQRLKIRATITQKMAEAAQLDPNTAQRMTEIINRYDDLIAGHQRDNRAALMELRGALQAPQPDVATVSRLNERIINNRNAELRAEVDRTAEIRRVLSPVQYARAALAYLVVSREIRRTIHHAIQDRAHAAEMGEEE